MAHPRLRPWALQSRSPRSFPRAVRRETVRVTRRSRCAGVCRRSLPQTRACEDALNVNLPSLLEVLIAGHGQLQQLCCDLMCCKLLNRWTASIISFKAGSTMARASSGSKSSINSVDLFTFPGRHARRGRTATLSGSSSIRRESLDPVVSEIRPASYGL